MKYELCRPLLSVLLIGGGFFSVQPALSQTNLSFELKGRWPGFPRGNAYTVEVADSHAFVAQWGGGLAVYNISQPTNIVRVGGYDTPGTAVSVRLAGTRAFVADGEWGLTVLEASPRFSNSQLTNGTFLASIHNLTGHGALVVESSTNLLNWAPLQTNLVSGLSHPFSTPWDSSTPSRFFRARVR